VRSLVVSSEYIRLDPRVAPEEMSAPVWWTVALRGLLAVLFGVVALANPRAGGLALVVVFAAWAFVDGVLAVVTAAHCERGRQRFGWPLFEGIASVAAAVFALAYPRLTLLALTIVVAVRAFLLGVFMIAGAIAAKGSRSRGLFGITGVVSALFGIALLWQPFAGVVAFLWTIGVYAIVFGAMSLVIAIRLRGPQRNMWRPSPPRPAAAAR